MKNKQISLLGVPLDLGAENLGVDMGANAFRYQHLQEKLQSAGMQIKDLGNIQCRLREEVSIGDKKLKYLDEILRVSRESAEKIFKVVSDNKQVIVLGGDHSVSLGAVSGASVAVKGDMGLIYFDAHGDMNTDKTTLTGNIHGMHLASLMGFGDKRLVNVFSDSVKVNKKNMLHIGANDLDTAEINLIKNEKLVSYQMFDVLSEGLKPLFTLIDRLSLQVKNVWVSLDLDSIDSTYAPGAGMPNKAGLTYREITTIAKYIGQHCHVIGVDIVEYNPLQDVEGKTAELGIELVAKFLGHEYSWYTNYLEKNKS